MTVKLDRTRAHQRTVWILAALLVLAALFFVAGCGATLAQLGRIIQPPRFAQAEDQAPEIRLTPPSAANPVGGAGVTLWIEVENPNPFGLTLTTLDATLRLEGNQAATGSFPLGLRLGAGATSVVPLDLGISFSDVPGLSSVVRQAVNGQPVAYQLDGTVGVDAGRFGQPTFGPLILVRGDLRIGG